MKFFCGVLLALMTLASYAHAESKPATEIGTLAGAAYRIDVPPDWNRRVVVFFHGTSETPLPYTVGEPLSPGCRASTCRTTS